jgi:hypothetical protein
MISGRPFEGFGTSEPESFSLRNLPLLELFDDSNTIDGGKVVEIEIDLAGRLGLL